MQRGLTRKQLIHATGIPFYTIAYLRDLGRLPVIKASAGKGVPNLYHPDAIDVIRKYAERGAVRSSN